jgi:hypothetical protein
LADDRRFAGTKRDLGRDLEGSFGRSREGSFAGVRRDSLFLIRRDPSQRSGKILRGVGIIFDGDLERSFAGLG